MDFRNIPNSRRHHRRAQAHALSPPAEGDLGLKQLKPRFSPTAIFTTPTATNTTPAKSTPTLEPTSQTPTPAPVSTSPALVTTPSTTATSSSSSSPLVVLPTTTTTTSSTPSTSLAVVPVTTPSTSSTTPLVTETLPSSSVAVAATLFTTIPPASSTSSTPSPSATVGSGTSTSAVVGGIAGGLVGVAGLIFLTMFLLRKLRKKDLEDTDFNADAFKRQSAVLVDDEPFPARGFNPRPPTMIERHMAGNYDSQGVPPMPSLQQYHNVGNYTSGGYGNEYDNSQAPSFGPGQVMSPTPGFSPYSPQSAYDQQGEIIRHPSSVGTVYTAHSQTGQLNRHASNGGALSNPYASGTDPAHYVDLDRSSVTPFQAAQYAEISRKLNTAPPVGLGAVQEGEDEPASAAIHYADGAGTAHLSIPVEHGIANPESPFADPHAQVAQILAKHQSQTLEREEQDILVPPRAITDDAIPGSPGSPVYSLHPPERVLSTPPKLPEIRVGAEERAFSPTSYDFPQTPSMRPSPFVSPFNNGHFAQEQDASLTGMAVSTDTPDPSPGPAAVTVGKREPKTNAARPVSSHTVYDEADVYGGI